MIYVIICKIKQDDHGGWKSWKAGKSAIFLNWAGKAGKTGISTFEILENFIQLFFGVV